MKKIGIIGIGRIGRVLAHNMLSLDEVSEIHLYNRNETKLEGFISSLNTLAFLINSKVKIKKINFDNINNLDIIIVSIKNDYDPRVLIKSKDYPSWLPKNLRYCGLPYDYNLIIEISHLLQNYAGIVGVITNPVEIVTKIISDNIKTNKVFGFGSSLDSLRISYNLFKKKKIKVEYSKINIYGEHGYDINIVHKISAKSCKHDICNEMINISTKLGFDIVNKMGYTLYECIPVFIDDIKWLTDNNNNNYRSFSHVIDNCFISRPFVNINNKIQPYQNYNDYEQKKFKIINNNLLNKYETILKNI